MGAPAYITPMSKTLRLDSIVLTSPVRTPEGFLKAPAIVTRAGIFEYLMPNGKIRKELRHPDQVFKQDSMDTLKGIVLTDGHPYADKGRVTPKNARRLQRGFTGSVPYRTDADLGVDVTVTDEESIAKIEAGKKALSLGYHCDMVEEAGEYEGKPYDARQENIEYNHLALVNRGRAGAGVELRLDEDLNSKIIPEEERSMKKIKLDDGTEIEVSEEAFAAFEKQKQLRQDAEKSSKDAKAELERTKGERDGLQTRLDAKDGDKSKQEAADKIKAAVKSRSALIGQAKEILPADKQTKLDDMDDLEIKKAVILHFSPSLKLDEASEQYIGGCYDGALNIAASKEKKAPVKTKLGDQIDATRQDEGEQTPQEAANARREKLSSKWKEKIPA